MRTDYDDDQKPSWAHAFAQWIDTGTTQQWPSRHWVSGKVRSVEEEQSRKLSLGWHASLGNLTTLQRQWDNGNWFSRLRFRIRLFFWPMMTMRRTMAWLSKDIEDEAVARAAAAPPREIATDAGDA